jgi:hypothetical protein
MKKITLLLLLFSFQRCFLKKQVSGKLTDATGVLTVGVNVLEKGTTNGTFTDF